MPAYIPSMASSPLAGIGKSAERPQHYENFPVAGILCPPGLRQPITAIYWFARTADDIADEGDASPEERLALLGAYRQELALCAARHESEQAADEPERTRPQGNPAKVANPGSGASPASDAGATAPPRWPHIFGPLGQAIAHHQLPAHLLDALLQAFEQDVHYTARGQRYASHDQLLDYCSRSANPVGRLLLHLYGVRDAAALEASDAICSSLQLINFWQDLSVDIPRKRFYLPSADCELAGYTRSHMVDRALTPGTSSLLASQHGRALALMASGQHLAKLIPGRAGWELRLVVQGGLCILRKCQRLGRASMHQRPRLSAWDAPGMLWRALWM
jgi:hydroxysqualene synthase